MNMRRCFIALSFVMIACSSDGYDQAYDRGYGDGYAVGYNTTCEIRATMISGDWDTEGYKSGYDVGYVAGEKQYKLDEPRFS
jgi:hypothetical protein